SPGRLARGERARLLDARARVVRPLPHAGARRRQDHGDAMTGRRDFLTLLGAAAAASLDAGELRAGTLTSAGPWDTSWLESLAAARYRVVFNASDVSDGVVLDYVSSFLDGFHEAHGTDDRDMRAVAVFRRMGTPVA